MQRSRTPVPGSPDSPFEKKIWLASLLLVLAGIAAWSDSFNCPFVFDDVGTILNNPTLLKLWPPWDALVGPLDGSTSSGRPLANLSLAANHALGGFDVRGYHVFNLSLHIAAGLTLFGVVRRTLTLEPLRERFGSSAGLIAFVCAALWLLHPLQTAAVTYTVQRAEVMASLFYLLTLYCFLRSLDATAQRFWNFLSFTCCLCGMASKEITVSLPLFVLLFDRTLVSDSFASAWRKRRGYYLALASTWLLLGILIAGSKNRGNSIGGSETITSWSYLLTQCQAIPHYLRLAIWPAPLVFDYGTATVSRLATVWPQAALLVATLSATCYAVWKRSPLGVVGAAFFALLAPSSSFVPIVTQTVAEHRMYLPVSLAVVLVVTATVRYSSTRSAWIFLVIATVFGILTFQRNKDYRDAITLWTDTAEKLPTSKRAHNNLGSAYFIAGNENAAITCFQKALALDPAYVNALVNLGRVQLLADKPAEATDCFQRALALDPSDASAHFGLGYALNAQGNLPDGIAQYREAIRLQPTNIDYRLKLAQALFRARQPTASIEEFRALLLIAPDHAEAHTGLGTVLASLGQFREAESELTEALRINPTSFDAHYNLGNALAQQNRVAEAIPHFEAALRLRPNHAGVRQILEEARAYIKSSK